MTKTASLIKPAFLGLCLFSVTGCLQHTNVGTPSPQEHVMRNSVQMVRLPLEITSEADGTDTLSAKSETAIFNFFRSIDAGYGDVIMLDGPSASPERLAAVEATVRRSGLTFGGVSALGSKPSDGSVMLYVERYIVQTPNCNYWPEVTSTQEVNNDSSFHGCATTINLGLMIADPRDLIAGRTSGSSSAAAVSAITGNASGPSNAQSSSSAPDTQTMENFMRALGNVANSNNSSSGNQ